MAGQDLAVELERAQERLTAAIDCISDAFYAVDGAWRLTLFNAAAEKYFGVPAQSVLGRNIWDIFPQGKEAEFGQALARVKDGGPPETLRTRSALTPGRTIDVRIAHFDGGVCVAISDLTAHEEAELKLAQSEERLRIATDAATLGAYEIDLSTGEGVWAASAFRLLGIEPPADLRGAFSQWRGALHPDDRQRVERAHNAALAAGEAWRAEYRIIRADTGAIRWLETFGRFTPGAGGTTRSIGVAVDVTDRKLAEESLRLNERRLVFLNQLADATREGAQPEELMSVTARLVGEHLGVDLCAYADVEADEDGFTIRGDWARQPGRTIKGAHALRDFGARAVAELRAGRSLINTDNRAEGSGFEALGLRSTICVPLIKGGKLKAMMAVHRDEPGEWDAYAHDLLREITERSWAHIERVAAESELRESERRYRTLFEAIDEGFCIIEFVDGPHGPLSDYVHVEANPAYTTHAGIPDVVGKYVRDMVGAEAEGWIELYGGVLRTGEPIRFERELEATGRWLELAAFRIEPASRRQVAVLFQDQTAKRQAEAALRESEENFRTLARVMPNQAWTARPDGYLDWFNERVYAFSGAPRGSLDGDGWASIVHPDDVPAAAVRWAAALQSGELYEAEFRLRRDDGAWRWHIARAVPIRDEDGDIVRWIGTNTDIQDQKEIAATLEQRVAEEMEGRMRVEEALRQSQKMESIGQLTGGIAHDFNNLLAAIGGSFSLIERRLADGKPGVDRYIGAGQDAVRRAASLTQRLLAFSRRQTLDPKPTDVNRLISGMEELIRRTVGPDVRVEVVGAAGLWATKVDPSQLESALLNLCINGRDAMAPAGGRLTIETANKWLDDRAARERDLKPGQYLSLCVTDTGCGMAPDVIERAFDPFFTTKPIGQGTGLGLSMVYGFVRQSGGQVRIYSEVGKGTTVCLYLPRYAEKVEEEPEEAQASALEMGHGETVLVIDDEPALRMMIVDVLEESGYKVLQAGSGPEGLRYIERGRNIDLLITDVGLPGGMNGRQVADAARWRRADLKVLFITGYAENAALGNGDLAPGMEIVTKPFVITDFASKVREILDR